MEMMQVDKNLLQLTEADAHSKLVETGFSAPANHQTIARFKNMKRTGNAGTCQGTDEDWNFQLISSNVSNHQQQTILHQIVIL